MSLTDRLERTFARVPLTVTAAGFVLGAVLADTQMVLLLQLNGGAEPPQWWGRVTVTLYWVIVPLALLALWARRRGSLGRLGQVGAWLNVPQIPAYAFITAAALVWGGAMGRGDLPGSVMWLEHIALAVYLGIVLLAIAYMRLPGSARLIGVCSSPAWWGALCSRAS